MPEVNTTIPVFRHVQVCGRDAWSVAALDALFRITFRCNLWHLMFLAVHGKLIMGSCRRGVMPDTAERALSDVTFRWMAGGEVVRTVTVEIESNATIVLDTFGRWHILRAIRQHTYACGQRKRHSRDREQAWWR